MVIVGLNQIVQDDVNKLICKFVGVKPHPLAKLLKPLFQEYFITLPGATEFSSSDFLWVKHRCYRCFERLEGDEITGNHFNLCSFCIEDGSDPEREEESEEEEED